MNLKSFKLLVLFLALCYWGAAREVKRVISLTPSVTENIYLIGAKNKLVGCTSYCTQAVNDGVEQVGTTVNVNIEKIFALQPDLVLTMKLTKPQDVAAMKKLGIKVEVMETPKTFNEICQQTLHIAELIGNDVEAKTVIETNRNTVTQIKKKCLQLNIKSKIFFQIGANPIFTVLQNTFMDDFITLCNAENIAAGMTKGTITRESVLVKNPDVIIIATMGGFGKEEQKVWKTFKGISAVKKNKVFLIDSNTSCSPTPTNFASALSDVFQFVTQ